MNLIAIQNLALALVVVIAAAAVYFGWLKVSL